MDDFINALSLLGIPAIVLVPVLVEGLKRLGLPARWAGLAAVGVGLAVAGLAEAVNAWPAVTPVVRFLVAGLLLGFASAGVYSQFKVFKR